MLKHILQNLPFSNFICRCIDLRIYFSSMIYFCIANIAQSQHTDKVAEQGLEHGHWCSTPTFYQMNNSDNTQPSTSHFDMLAKIHILSARWNIVMSRIFCGKCRIRIIRASLKLYTYIMLVVMNYATNIGCFSCMIIHDDSWRCSNWKVQGWVSSGWISW